ncbi:ABC-F family ATP-binding cassette domain-containing protein [Paenibacillus alvei]|uniref:ABC-F family ATP-binding cassette domain-containing protein n=1 Tax=Paenibacillus alvei TaxID=44250 RepID=UPI0018CE321E|nr:ABC-F family ATP-binding cassette domain-containing protein [Paenibacillus alvei]MBG9736402.1 ABC transporter [Paenibacillus alvei]MBG9742948.1 ABC transporter [Paenibacillus alvei]MCY9577852.1 ABC-F family ATP-binding cassette domain-containing protein [Paenibacillus alvei]MCY9586976.1 ABC-F family ATP-binding cassette domain-containing protein [Paenibacillus alvei]
MHVMTIEQLGKSYGDKTLFKDVSFGIEAGDRIGIVGVNGTGKSTFLRTIMGLEPIEEGKIMVGNRVRVQYVPQEPEYDPNATVLDQVMGGDAPEMVAIRTYTESLESAAAHPNDEQVQQRLVRASDDMDRLQAWQLESDAKTILSKLGIHRFDARMGDLSGGQRKRVALASALIHPSDLLMLDEPTNHIDNDTVAWLETLLQKRSGALIMITHDRYFLDRVANRMIELDQGRAYFYEANYTRFLELKADREAREAASEDKRQNLLRNELAWIRRGAQARSTKQKARIQRFEELQANNPLAKNGQVEISAMSARLGKKIMELDALGCSIDGRVLFRDLSYITVPEDRIGIIGPNGSGKSTLLRVIAGMREPQQGSIVLGPTVRIGFFTQEHEEMDESLRVIEYIREGAETVKTAEGHTVTAAQMLERFMFSPTMQWTLIGKLSGGEKRRLQLLRILMEAPNVLLLDEPTNDLDVQTLAVLEQYLDDFPGVVITVSHDRYFLDRVAERIWSFENGHVNQHVGNYSEYMEWQSKHGNSTNSESSVIQSKVATDATEPGGKPERKPKLKMSYKEEREYEQIEERIMEAESNIERIQQDMEQAFNDSVRLQELMKEDAEAQKLLEHLMERWTYLSELAEQIEAEKSK